MNPGSGPLHGVRVLEFASLTPGPFACMLLSDLGADVVRIDRPDPDPETNAAILTLSRGRRSICLDLKRAPDGDVALRLIEKADALVEGFRPGVMERLGLGPDLCLDRNPGLVYGRMTGWGQSGPRSHEAGHDINYIGLAGALDPVGMAGERPIPPGNMVGDLGGGGMVLALGLVAALYERTKSGRGQVVDAAIVDGAAMLTSGLLGLRHAGLSAGERGENLADGGAPFYDTYRTSDGRYMAVGAVEPKFFAALLRTLGLSATDLPDQLDRNGWPILRQVLQREFGSRTQAEWSAAFIGVDACVTPVVRLGEAHRDPHNTARGTFVHVDGLRQPAPVPRFSRSVTRVASGAPAPGEGALEALRDWGLEGMDEIV